MSSNPWVDFVHIVITELQSDLSGKQQHSGGAGDDKFQKGRFYVEEPLDYIFEPDHYKREEEGSGQPEEKKKKDEDAIFEPDHYKKEEEGEGQPDEKKKRDNESEMNVIDNENQFKHARVVRENDEGFLEYEYKSYTYKRDLYSNLAAAAHDFANDYHLLNDYDAESHLNAAVRSVSMCKWPGVGFGFDVTMQQFGPEAIYFVCGVRPDSPAEMGLRLGDILIEIDERNTRKGFAGGVPEINDYLNSRDSVHLLVIHESKYHMVKSSSDFLDKPHHVNCEDFVIVSHSR